MERPLDRGYIPPEHILALAKPDSTPHSIQEAINTLDPNSAFAAQESAEILCAAESILRRMPEDEDAHAVMERALKIYHRHHLQQLN